MNENDRQFADASALAFPHHSVSHDSERLLLLVLVHTLCAEHSRNSRILFWISSDCESSRNTHCSTKRLHTAERADINVAVSGSYARRPKLIAQGAVLTVIGRAIKYLLCTDELQRDSRTP